MLVMIPVDQAIEYGWSVSFPIWQKDCKDINDAVVTYGKLYTFQHIMKHKNMIRNGRLS